MAGASGHVSISNAFIDDILADKDPFSLAQEEAKQEEEKSKKEELKVGSFVVALTNTGKIGRGAGGGRGLGGG